MSCKHHNFKANVAVNRLEDSGGFMADVRITCTECDLPFEFIGLEPGLKMQGAAVSIDGQELRIAISPMGSRPNPLQQVIHERTKFDG
jgi:hypothetical protein